MASDEGKSRTKPAENKTHIPIDAEVDCLDGRCGTSVMVIVNPVTQALTHLVVDYQGSEYLVALEKVAASAPESIILNGMRDELRHLDLFLTSRFVETDLPDFDVCDDDFVEPYVYLEQDVLYEEERIPAGELAVRRGTEVQGRDGRIGSVDEFVGNRDTGDITHLVLREGHLWGKRVIATPVGRIEETNPDRVILKLTREEVEKLPRVRIKRWWDQRPRRPHFLSSPVRDAISSINPEKSS